MYLDGHRRCGFKACTRLLHMTDAVGIETQTPRSRVHRLNCSAMRSTIRLYTLLLNKNALTKEVVEAVRFLLPRGLHRETPEVYADVGEVFPGHHKRES